MTHDDTVNMFWCGGCMRDQEQQGRREEQGKVVGGTRGASSLLHRELDFPSRRKVCWSWYVGVYGEVCDQEMSRLCDGSTRGGVSGTITSHRGYKLSPTGCCYCYITLCFISSLMPFYCHYLCLLISLCWGCKGHIIIIIIIVVIVMVMVPALVKMFCSYINSSGIHSPN